MSRRGRLINNSSTNNGWLGAYACIITLLLMFFVLLGRPSSNALPAANFAHIQTESTSLFELYSQLLEYKDNNRLFSIEISSGEGYIMLRFPDSMLFEPNGSRLKPSELYILDFVADAVERANEEVQAVWVSGHAAEYTTQPQLNTSDRLLSAARANAVLMHLEEKGLASRKLVLLAYGKNYPIDDNSTPLGASRNQRVEILISSEELFLEQSPAVPG